MANNQQSQGKKIGEAEMVIMMLLSLTSDLLELLTLGTIGIIINAIVGGLIMLWIAFRRLKYTRFLVSAALDLIPFVNALPLKSFGLWLTIKAANNPKLSAATQIASIKKGVPN